MIVFGAIVMLLMPHGMAGNFSNSLHYRSECSLLFPPLVKGGLGGVVPAQPTVSPIKEALRDGKYPWYDSRADRVQPVWPVRISWLERLGERTSS